MLTLFYQGLLSTLGQSAPNNFQAAEIFDKYEDVVVTLPFTPTNDGDILKDDNTYQAMNILNNSSRPVWIRILCASPFRSQQDAFTRVPLIMSALKDLFVGHLMEDKLKGFYLAEFGFEAKFGDGMTMTRQLQNHFVGSAWSLTGVPVMASAVYPADYDMTIGPSNRGSEPGAQLWRPILGTNPAFADKAVFPNPLYDRWFNTFPRIIGARIQEYLSIIKARYDGFQRYTQPVFIQNIDMSNASADSTHGIRMDSATIAYIRNYVTVMRALGITNYGVTNLVDVDYSLHIPYPYLNETFVSDHKGSGFGTPFTDQGSNYIDNQVLDSSGKLVPARFLFDANWKYLSRLI